MRWKLLRRRLRISSRDFRYVLLVAVITTIVTSSVAFVMLSPPASERFFATWVLGTNGLAQNYFPNNDTNIGLNEQLNWTLGVYNHMGSLEYVVIRVKLLNSSIRSPDELAGTPSPAPVIFQFTRVLLVNETWSHPFVWKITNFTLTKNTLLIRQLSINQFPVTNSFVTAEDGLNLRFVFELWFYDQGANDLVFSSQSGGSGYVAWTQLWFNVTTTRP